MTEIPYCCKTPYAIDHEITEAAGHVGYTDVHRRRKVKIDDSKLPPHYFRKTPDYRKILKDLEDGVIVPGAELTDEVEYVLGRPEAK